VRRVPYWTPVFAIGCGLAAALAAAFLPKLLGAEELLYHERIFAVVGVGLLAYFGSRRWARELDPVTLEREQHFFELRDRPIDFASEVGSGNDTRQMRVMGFFAWALTIAFLMLLIPASSAGHHLEFIALALTCAAVGVTLLWRSRRSPPGVE
jgi:hypothetical protein